MSTETTATVPAGQVRDLIAAGTWSHETIGKAGARESVHMLKLSTYVTYPVFTAVRDQAARLGGHYVKSARGFAFPVARPTFPNGWTKDGRETVAEWLAGATATPADAAPVADVPAPVAEPVATAPAAPTVTDVPADWSAPVERLDTVDVRKAVAEALRAYFPGVKFSARSDRYAGGSAVRVSWTDGPTTKAVDLIISRYAGAGFDGMADCKTYRGAVLLTDARGNARAVTMGADYVNGAREISDEYRASMAPHAAAYAGRPVADDDYFGEALAGQFGVWLGFDRGRALTDYLARTVPAGHRTDRDAPACGARGEYGRTCDLIAGHPFPLVHSDDARPFLADDSDDAPAEPVAEPVADVPAEPVAEPVADVPAEPVAEPVADDAPSLPAIIAADVAAYRATDPRPAFGIRPAAWLIAAHADHDAEPVADDAPAEPVAEPVAPWHRCHPATSGAYCVAYANGTRTVPASDPVTTIHADVTCAECVATFGKTAEQLAKCGPWTLRTLPPGGNPNRPEEWRDGEQFTDRAAATLAAVRMAAARTVYGVRIIGADGMTVGDWHAGDNMWSEWGRLGIDYGTGSPEYVKTARAIVDGETYAAVAAAASTDAADRHAWQLIIWNAGAGRATFGETFETPHDADRAALRTAGRPFNYTVSAFLVRVHAAATAVYRYATDAEPVAVIRHGGDDDGPGNGGNCPDDAPTDGPGPVAEPVAEPGPDHAAELYRARKIRPGDSVTVSALHDRGGERVERVTLAADTVTRLGCGCDRIDAARPGDGTGPDRVAVKTGCGFHPSSVIDSAPAGAEPVAPVVTADMLAEAERLGREAYGFGAPAAPAADGALTGPAGMVAGWPVGGGAAEVFAAWSRGFSAAADRAAADAVRTVELSDQQATAAAVVAERNPAAQECADIAAAGAESARLTLANRTATAEAGRALLADPVDVPAAPAESDTDGPAEPVEGDDGETLPDVYTLPLDAYTPTLDSDGPDSDLTITHDHENGTVMDGGAKGDGTLEIVRAHGFTWKRYAGVHIAGSRDRFARLADIHRAAVALRAAGHTVAVEIDDVWRPAAVREEHRAARVSARVERLAARSSARYQVADQRRAAAESITDGMPFGEPVKIGHHSERAHRRAFERIDSHTRASYAAQDYAQHLAGRAEGAEANEAAKHNPRAIMRRVETMETESREWGRRLDEAERGNAPRTARRARLELEKLAEDIGYQRGKLGELAESGEFVAWSREHIQRGDLVRVRGTWCGVVRVNRKTVSVSGRYSWSEGTGTPTTWDEITGRRRNGMQWDSPNAEPWPAADADRVARWGELVHLLGVPKDNDEETRSRTRNTEAARRLVLGLRRDATAAEVAAFGEPGDRAGKIARALAMMAAYDRLAAGESFDQVAGDVAPIADTVPAWTMPTGETVDVTASELAPGDIMAGSYDRFFSSGERLVPSPVGPVQTVPKTRDRRESGEWVTVTIDGTEHDFRSFRRFAVHRRSAAVKG